MAPVVWRRQAASTPTEAGASLHMDQADIGVQLWQDQRLLCFFVAFGGPMCCALPWRPVVLGGKYVISGVASGLLSTS